VMLIILSFVVILPKDASISRCICGRHCYHK